MKAFKNQWEDDFLVSDDEVCSQIRAVPKHYSASYLVDLFNTCQMGASVVPSPNLSGALVAPLSGVAVGAGVNLAYSDSLCNMFVAGVTSGGVISIQVQCSDTDTSGLYTDPTSGLAVLPSVFQSGGFVQIGNGGGIFSSGFASGGYGQQAVFSGFLAAASFQRPNIFARAVVWSGTAGGPFIVGFISQLRTTGSGGGYTLSPLTTPSTISV